MSGQEQKKSPLSKMRAGFSQGIIFSHFWVIELPNRIK